VFPLVWEANEGDQSSRSLFKFKLGQAARGASLVRYAI
jgi:hypothetical protein